MKQITILEVFWYFNTNNKKHYIYKYDFLTDILWDYFMKLNFCTNIIVFFKLYFIIVFNNYIKLDSKIQKY